MANTQKYGKEARAALRSGINKLNAAVSVTLGPAGRNVLFRHMGQVISTKDGVTVAREINLADPYESIGADLIKAAAGQTVDEAGDGTTTATLLAAAIFNKGCEAIDAGAEPVQLVKGIQQAVTAIVGDYDAKAKKFSGGILETMAVPCTPELAFSAARISANGDDAIAKVVSDAVIKVGADGALSIGDSYSQDHVLEVTEGLQIHSGMSHPYFMNDAARNRTVLENVTVLVLNRRLNNAQEAVNLVSGAVKAVKRSERAFALLIIADDYDNEAVAQLIHCRKPKEVGGDNLPIVAIRAPLWGDARRDMLEDICLVTESTRVSDPTGKAYDSIGSSIFGHAKRVVVTDSKTTITADDLGDEYRTKWIDPYLARLQSIINDVTLRPDQIDSARQRYAALTGGVAVIKVGGSSANSVAETKFRVEDAIHACRAAVLDGVLPGGGSALLFARAIHRSGEKRLSVGEELLLDCLSQPIQQIAENAGYTSADVIDDVKESSGEFPRGGFDASRGLFINDMISTGIVDPLRVVRAALNAAASNAATVLLKTECVIAHDAANTPQQLPQ